MEENNSKMRSEQLLEKIKQTVKLLDEIELMISTQAAELSKVDSELSDWLHIIENNELSKEECFNVMERMHALRIERRELNNEYELEKVYQTHKSKLSGNETRQFLIAEINKKKKELNQEYKNRVLTDENIKNVLGEEEPKKRRGRPKKIKEEETVINE